MAAREVLLKLGGSCGVNGLWLARKSLGHFLAENPLTAVYPVIQYFWLPGAGLILLTIYRLVNVNHKINEQPVRERVSSGMSISLK